MPVTDKQLKRSAEGLAGEARDEAGRRSAISRVYYAAYHRCLRWERSLPAMSPARTRGGVHRQLIARLQTPDVECNSVLAERSRRLGQLLEDQFRRRVDADYHLQASLSASELDAQLSAAREVFEKCADPNT